jgi:RNA polymerase sigma-70 factor (ECF subfamily)
VENNQQHGIDEYAARLIRHKAYQLIGTAGFTASDRQDLEQEMVLDLIMRLPKFDENKATHKTFVARIIERKISKLIRHRTQEIRDYRREGRSLNEQIVGDDGAAVERGDTLAHDEVDRRLSKRQLTRQEHLDLVIDMADVISLLPDHLRRLCELLQTDNVSDAARQAGIPRTTINDHVRKLRALFEDAKLGDYL